LHAAVPIAQDAVEDAQQFAGLDSESGFFAGFADSGIADVFAAAAGASALRGRRGSSR